VPCVADRALQRSAAQVLSAIYEQDFLPCSFGGRPGRGAHQGLASLHEVISGRQVEWVLEADLKNFFGSLSHEWMLRFVEHRVVWEICTLRSVGAGERATALGHPVGTTPSGIPTAIANYRVWRRVRERRADQCEQEEVGTASVWNQARSIS